MLLIFFLAWHTKQLTCALNLTWAFTFVQVFLLQGRLIFGPDIRSIFLTIFLIAVPAGVFCGFIGRKLMDEYSDSFGIWIVVVTVLFTIYVSLALFQIYPTFETFYYFVLCLVTATCTWISKFCFRIAIVILICF